MTKSAPEPLFEMDRKVTLRVVAPAWCTHMNFPGDGGDTLTVGRTGTEVPADAAQDLINTAAQHGVTITEVSEQ